jgi:quercetin dioxygenase-like cupin family protein
MITRRDVVVALVGATLCAAALAGEGLTPMHTTVFEWNAVSSRATPVGALRQFFRAPTATLDELEMHVTTLNPGQTSHAPHRHANEELVIVKDGTVEMFAGGEWKRVGPGSVLFAASNELHGLRNVGTAPATYHVINWTSSKASVKDLEP